MWEVDMKRKVWKDVLSRTVCWVCYAAVIAVLAAFGLRLGRGVGEVRRGEMTPAEMLEELGDWMTGKE
jgi:hypothetical protein